MEDTNQFNNNLEEENLTITLEGAESLNGVIKWAKRLAIFGLSVLVLLLLFICIMPFPMTSDARITVIAFYIIVLGIVAIPLFFLYKFAATSQDALNKKSSDLLADGLNSLKSCFLIQSVFFAVAIAMFIFLIFAMFFDREAMVYNSI